MREREFNMDLGRAVAISMVTAFHVWRFTGHQAYVVAGHDLFGLASAGLAGVDVFFVISGYAMVRTWAKIRHQPRAHIAFWKARLFRLYPPYLVAIVVWCLLLSTGLTSTVKPHGVRDIVSHMLFLHTFDQNTFFSISGVFWTLSVEAHFYLLFPFLIKQSRQFRCAVACVSLLFSILIAPSFASSAHPNVILWNVLVFLPLFVIGMELATVTSYSRWIGIPSIIGMVLAVEIVTSQQLSELAMFTRIFIGTCVATTCLVIAPRTVRKSHVAAVVTTVGTTSYSIYLYNYAFTCFPALGVPSVWGWASTFALIFCCGLFAWMAVELPSEHWRRGLRAKSRELTIPNDVGVMVGVGSAPDDSIRNMDHVAFHEK
jgi:peptidoglycan/LPS O-acetylase OafA/YrhL